MKKTTGRTGMLATLLMAGVVVGAMAMAGVASAAEGMHKDHMGMHGPGMGIHGMRDPQWMVQFLSRWLDLDEAQTCPHVE